MPFPGKKIIKETYNRLKKLLEKLNRAGKPGALPQWAMQPVRYKR